MKKKVIEIYEQREKNHFWYQARRNILWSILNKGENEIEASTESRKIKSIIEIGCGAGINLRGLSKEYTCIGIEPDPFLAKRAQENNEGMNIYKDGLPSDFHYLNRKFDYILLLDVLEHINDDYAALRSLSPVLAKHGKIIINVPAHPWMWSAHDKVAKHHRRYTKKNLISILEQSNLEVLSIRYWGAWPLLSAFFARKILVNKNVDDDYTLSSNTPACNTLARHLLISEFNITKHIPIPFGLSLLVVATAK